MNAQFENVTLESFNLFHSFKKEVDNIGNLAVIDLPVDKSGLTNDFKLNDYIISYDLWATNYFILSKDEIHVTCYAGNLDALLDYIEEKLGF